MDTIILLAIFLPAAAGILLLVSSFADHIRGKGDTVAAGSEAERKLEIYYCVLFAISAAFALAAVWTGHHGMESYAFLDGISLSFQADGLSKLYVTVISVVWGIIGVYSLVYMKHEGEQKRFYGFFFVAYAVLVALSLSGNLITMYLFYELMTLTTVPLVLHNGSREAIMAALKYLFYSMCGAYLGLFGIFYMYKYCDTLSFVEGGSLNTTLLQGHEGILLVAVMAALIGFGAKAGMFPLHAWLPTAHPVAPSPASALMSGTIVKFGVLAIIRVVYYVVGADFLRGTWVQTVWMSLALLTVFMGSMLAYREKIFKKRLAYSTVSQISYILFGLAVMEPQAVTGALLHVVFHAFIKCTLFMTAGIFIIETGKKYVDEYKGIGKQMPKTLWCYTFVSLALIGIPPASGFISKWYLAEGALQADIGFFSWLGPVILLVSALLTAGYLLPVTMNGFFPGEGAVQAEQKEAPGKMLVPLMIFAAAAVLFGVFPNPLTDFINEIVSGLM